MKNLKWFKGDIYSEGDMVTNPFSGESIKLNNIELSLYDYIMGVEMVRHFDENFITKEHLKIRSKCIDYFLENNIDAYYKLID